MTETNTTATPATVVWSSVRNDEQVAYRDALYSGSALGTVVLLGTRGGKDYMGHLARREAGRQVSSPRFPTRAAARRWVEANA